jgi:ATP-binding cassette subfamily B protein
VAIGTVALYGAGTFMISDWRIHHRRALNEADSEAAGRSVDALMNYETVKSFGAEDRSARHYDEALQNYARAAVKANTSLVMLNVIQSAVMSLGLAAMAVLAGMSAAAGKIGPGDVTSAVLIMIQVYQPLAILGFAYREIRQSIIDMEAMVELRRQRPAVADAIDARDLPEGMETMVGERGLKLSGGERQRVGLARALLTHPRLLILDEATSALDSRTEAAIQATLRRLRGGRTTLVVAHRLSTIADADQILVLKGGRIVEVGDHAGLIDADGEYASLWRRQTRKRA